MDETRLANLIIRHEKVARGMDRREAAKIVRLLNETIADLKEKLLGRYAVALAKGADRGPATTRRLEEMLKGFEALNARVYRQIGRDIEAALIDRAQYEFEFVAKAAQASGFGVVEATTLPDTNYFVQLVRNIPIPVDPYTSALLKPWLDGMERGNLDRLGRILRTAFNTGETPQQLAKTLEAQGFAKSRQSAESLALTANSSVANEARLETFRGMRSIGYVEWSSILDSRTSPGCQDLSGKIFPLDKPHPKPPRHIRCRSILIPRRNDTDPPKHKPYREWLADQDANTQDEVLGKKRAQLFRDGKITNDELYADDGSFVTLEELKRRDSKLFD